MAAGGTVFLHKCLAHICKKDYMRRGLIGSLCSKDLAYVDCEFECMHSSYLDSNQIPTLILIELCTLN